MSIIICGDIMPTSSNYKSFCNADSYALVGKDLFDILSKSDYCIANLETPITDKCSPISKCGPVHRTPSNVLNGLQALGISIVGLANNHILDQGCEGLKSTIECLDEHKIAYVGAGKNLSYATMPYVFTYEDRKIGIYACAEHEFSIANSNSFGANPYDPLESMDHIKQLRKICNYIVVLYHGGKEYYRYPSPNLQHICRKFIEKGADLVLCQHSHCIGCEEKYREGTILYGQGNFIFDDGDNEFVSTGLLVKIDDNFNISYIPICKNDSFTRLANSTEAKIILQDFSKRSQDILEPGFIENQYSTFSNSMVCQYLLAANGKESFIFRVANKLLLGSLRKRKIKHLYDNTNSLKLLNYIECESHRELFIDGLREWIKNT